MYIATMINPETEFQIEATGDVLRWTVPLDLSYFRGHFPDQPILPAVAILDAVVEILKSKCSDKNLILKEVKNAKFMKPIFPGMEVEMTLEPGKDGSWKCQWRSKQDLLVDLEIFVTGQIFN